MNYFPITVTQDNLDWSVRENIRRAFTVLATKSRIDLTLPQTQIDAGGFLFRLAAPAQSDTAACTLQQAQDLASG